MQPLADEYLAQIDADASCILGPSGAVLAPLGRRDRRAAAGRRTGGSHEGSTLRCRTPRAPAGRQRADHRKAAIRPDVIGRLTVGFFLDDRRAVQFKAVTGTEIAFAPADRVLASSLPAAARGRRSTR